MTGSVARHCEPTHNWTLDSALRDQRTIIAGSASRRAAPFEWTSDVTDDFYSRLPQGVFITPEDTGRRVSDSLQSTRRSAERRQMFEATPRRVAALQPRDDRPTSVQKFKQPQSTLSQLATRKSGKPKQYDRGENSPLGKNLQSFTALQVRTA
jgi:hypothetical protein